MPEVQPRTSATEIEETAQLVLAYADGERTVDLISRETGLGTFHTVKALYGLAQQGLVVLRAKRSIDASGIRKLVADFNMVLRDIFMAVARLQLPQDSPSELVTVSPPFALKGEDE